MLEPLHSTPVEDAITYFTRDMGSARSGDLEAARKNIAQIQEGLLQSKDDYWAQQVEIQRTAATAWVAYANTG